MPSARLARSGASRSLRAGAARLAFAGTLGLVLAGAARAMEPVPWNTLADVDTIQIVSTNPDGTPRETTIWLVVLDGQGYVRSSATHWLANVERDPDVMVEVEGRSYPLRAAKVTDSETYQQVTQAFRTKYGWSDTLTGLIRGLAGVPTILRLEPRTSLAPVD
jgi:hypothetical protein